MFVAACREPSLADNRRILLVTVDTLRYDLLAGAPGQPPVLARTSERFRTCQVFDRAYSASSTTQPTHDSLFTGLDPWEHALVTNSKMLPEGIETVPERMHQVGFAASAVVASFPVSGRFGFDQGFDLFDEPFNKTYAGLEGEQASWGGAHLPPGDRFYSLCRGVTQRAIAELESRQGQPKQFLWVHYFDPHGPYGDSGGGPRLGPKEAVRKALAAGSRRPVGSARRKYDRDVAALDACLEELLAAWDRTSEGSRDALVFTSDHGESLGEDSFMGHGSRLTEGQIRVPLVICEEGAASGRRPDPAGSVDVARTLLAMAGASADGFGGRDLREGPIEGAEALGARSLKGPGSSELRLDGRRYPMSGPLFFLADGSGLFSGDSTHFASETGPALSAERQRSLRQQFTLLERQILSRSALTLTDETTREALRALGYGE